MNLTQIESNLKQLVNSFDKETFVYDLLAAYYMPKATISRLQKGSLNLSKIPGEVSWKKKLFFKEELKRDLHLTITDINENLKQGQRFVIVTDYKTILAIDTITQDRLDIAFSDLPKYYDFFLPWAGMEKATHAAENPADVKAAEKMARLFDEIKKDNPDNSPEFVHNLNIFFSRLLFCYFSEDTNIFEDQQFTYAIQSHTQSDGSDLDVYLNRLFGVLNTPVDKRSSIPQYLNAFPYVNGGLFREEIPCPKFTSKSRQLLIDSGDSNDWSAINPDIFGSMFQAVISPEHRGGLGAHYTSVPNIMKVIEPLFLNELKETFEDASGNEKKLKELLLRISKIKLFDPACGSGNFLIIAYKELRRLEIEIIKALSSIKGNLGSGKLQLGNDITSSIHLNNFYGIELDDFAHEIATLSLWLAEHQMNVEFFNEFGRTNPTLPLQEAGQIVCGNACRLDWEMVCPKNEGDEIYIMGNPPYLGARMQNEIQKADLDIVFKGLTTFRDLDYISCWFYKGAKYIKGKDAKLAFVSTNSICQGLQVGLLWPRIFEKNLDIFFAHTSFKWQNNAKQNAAVIVVIIGLSNESTMDKFIYSDGLAKSVKSINAYLSEGSKTFITRRSKPLSFPFEMSFGNMPNDGGGLILDSKLKEEILKEDSSNNLYIKNFVGAAEFIQGNQRFCLWINEKQFLTIKKSKLISERIDICKNHRLNSKDRGTNHLALKPFQFRDTNEPICSQIIIPRVSSERREYVPIGFLSTDSVISDSAQAIYDAEPWLLSILTSKMHMVWLHNIGGKLKSDYRYAKDIVYNTFPFLPISNQRKEELTQCTFRILEEREKHPEKTLAQLYDPDKMPEGLKEAHRLNDEAVERCYRSTPFTSDEERLEYLFKLYEKMIQEEKEKGTLFETEKKTRKKK
jgi:hypothetical protein